MRKKIGEIFQDREIIPLEVAESLGEKFLQWEVKGVIWGDKVEELLENGYNMMVDSDGKVIVYVSYGEQSPEDISRRKEFFRKLGKTIDESD